MCLTTQERMTFQNPPPSCVCLFWLQHLLSLSFPFWYVFSDYKRGDDISSHPPPSCVCLFWLHNLPSLSFPFWYVFSDYKRGDDISSHPPSLSFPFWYVFSDYKRGDDISSHPPPSCVCLFWLPPGCWKHGGDLEKDLAVLAARFRSQRNVRVRFYYIHFKELESRYMSPIQGILVGFTIIITYTANEMHHDVCLVLSQSSTFNQKWIIGENLLRDVWSGHMWLIYDVFDEINQIYSSVIRRWVFRVCLVNESCSLYKFQDVCHTRQHFFQRIWNSTSQT